MNNNESPEALEELRKQRAAFLAAMQAKPAAPKQVVPPPVNVSTLNGEKCLEIKGHVMYLGDDGYDTVQLYDYEGDDDMRKYLISLETDQGSNVCLDIRQVINEIKKGDKTYLMGLPSEIYVNYYKASNIMKIIEKEKTLNNESQMENKIKELKSLLDTPENIEFFVAFSMAARVLLSFSPGNEIVLNNLDNEWGQQDLYKQTFDYNSAVDKIGVEVSLQYNPFDPHEHNHFVKNGKNLLEHNHKLFENVCNSGIEITKHNHYFPIRNYNANINANIKLNEKQKEKQKKIFKIRGTLDYEINKIKRNCFSKVMERCFIIKTKGDLSKAKTAVDFFKLLDNGGVSLIGPDGVLNTMYGAACLRSQGRQLLNILNFINIFINLEDNKAPTLNMMRKDVSIDEIPESYVSCFENLSMTYEYHFIDIMKEILVAEAKQKEAEAKQKEAEAKKGGAKLKKRKTNKRRHYKSKNTRRYNRSN